MVEIIIIIIIIIRATLFRDVITVVKHDGREGEIKKKEDKNKRQDCRCTGTRSTYGYGGLHSTQYNIARKFLRAYVVGRTDDRDRTDRSRSLEDRD